MKESLLKSLYHDNILPGTPIEKSEYEEMKQAGNTNVAYTSAGWMQMDDDMESVKIELLHRCFKCLETIKNILVFFIVVGIIAFIVNIISYFI